MPHSTRPHVRLLVAAVLGAMLLPAVPAVAAPEPAPAAATVVDEGSLSWGIRDSWRRYISLAGISATSGATVDGAGIIAFPVSDGSFDPDTGATTIQFSGIAHYEAHCGDVYAWTECALDLTIRDPRVVIDRDQQTLYAHVLSRPTPSSSAPTAPAIVDYGVIAFAHLDISTGTVQTLEGVTSWSDVRASMTEAGSPAIQYVAGTLLDPVAFHYTGPGGAPDLTETWTAPGSYGLTETHRWVAGGDEPNRTAPQDLYLDEGAGILHELNDGGTPRLQAFDADTLTLLASYTPPGGNVRSKSFDPTTGTTFLTQSSGSNQEILAVRLIDGSYTAESVVARPGGELKAIAWDAAGERLVGVITPRIDGVFFTQLATWTRTDTGWVEQVHELPEPAPGAANSDKRRYFGVAGANQTAAIAADGSFILGTLFGAGIRIQLVGDTVTVTELRVPDTSVASAFRQVTTGADGSIWFYTSATAIRFQLLEDGTVSEGTVTALGSGVYDWAAVDPADGTFWVKASATSELVAIRDGDAVYREVFANFSRYSQLTIAADHTVYSALRTDSGLSGIARFERSGPSPTITTQPEPASVSVPVDEDAADVVFTAAASGFPAPTVQWQQRPAGASRFADIAGEIDPTLSFPATARDDGSEYRAVFTNAAGELATEPAALTVLSAPSVLVQPTSATTAAGDTVSFLVMPGGNPDPTITWQTKTGGTWRTVTVGNGITIDGGTLTIGTVAAQQNGAQYRAELTNTIGTVYSDPATLTVVGTGTGGPTEQGSLTWGVKASFRDYITGPIARGSISLSGGAASSGGGFRFGQSDAAWDSESGTGTGSYRGAVRFYGRGGILDLTLSSPSIQITSPSSATLYVSANGSRVAIANVNLAAASKREVTGGVAYSAAPTTLTAAGANLFSYGSSRFYATGTSMDPVSFVIGAASTMSGGGGTVAAFQETEWTPPATPPAKEGIEGDPDELKDLHAGSELTVWADGFQPNETDIKVVIYSDPTVLEGNLTADATGRATWTGLIPANLAPGAHTLTFQGSVNRGIVLTIGEARELDGCPVQDADLTWGFKESFRAYIDGSIANGEWTVSDGATYDTPEFGWADGEGVYDPQTHTGLVSFTGTIRFTGHDGLLDTTVANPQLRFVDENTAYLLLDVAGVTMEDAMAGNTGNPVVATAVPFVKLDLAGGDLQVADDGTVTATGIPSQITSEGYTAFPNYEAGTEFDPVSFTIPVTDCATPTEADGDTGTLENTGNTAPELTWLLCTAIAVLIAAGIVVTIILVRRRRTAA